jgi:choline-sulfatase
MADRPNIVFIFPDQHRGDAMGCVGNPAETPNINRLAAEGVLFNRCATNSPLCMPARASLITGQYVNQHGVWANNVEADPAGPSHVRNMRDAGYRTSLVGKTHLWIYRRKDGHTRERVPLLQEWGYEDSHELRDIINYADGECYYSDFLAERNRLPVFREYLRTIARGENRGYARPWETPPSLLPEDENLDAYCTAQAAKWIREYGDDQPFYLQVCPTGPHNPFDSSASYRERCVPETMPLAIMDAPSDPVSPQIQNRWRRLANMTEAQNRVMRSYYYAKVSEIDNAIGQVIEALTEKGMMENTWIIYSSDHGEMLGDHRMSGKSVFYEGAVHVPLIIRPPTGSHGWRSNGLTDHFDITSTMLDIAGAAPFENANGQSLKSRVEAGPDAADAQNGKDVVFSELELYSMARDEQYKMNIRTLTREPLELYDMVNDPHELHNLVQMPSMQTVRDRFLEGHFSQLLGGMDPAKVKTYQETVEASPNLGN